MRAADPEEPCLQGRIDKPATFMDYLASMSDRSAEHVTAACRRLDRPVARCSTPPARFRQVLALPVVVDFGPRRTWMLRVGRFASWVLRHGWCVCAAVPAFWMRSTGRDLLRPRRSHQRSPR